MDSVTEEAVEKLMKEKHENEKALTLISNMKIQDIWYKELDELKKEYINFSNNIENPTKSIIIKKKKK